MDVLISRLRFAAFAVTVLFLSGCQIGYYYKAAKGHIQMISKREEITDVLKKPDLDPKVRSKLEAAVQAHRFSLDVVGLKETDNYTSYIDLGRPYVSWVVSAAPRWKLEHHEWKYPFVGKMPYKGFTEEDDAKEEQKQLEEQNLDTALRGVSAFSTLGWFKDSVLSSMLRGTEYDLVNTIIHETVHATLYIKNSADFNERLAVFIGNKATEQFYLAKEGPDSPTVKKIAMESEDDRIFSSFIGPELKALKSWYESLPESERKEETRKQRFKEIQNKFAKEVLPTMKAGGYKRFPELELNNARLLYYKMYLQDLGEFETLFQNVGMNWKTFLQCAKSLEKAKKPEDSLKALNEKWKMTPGCP